MANRIINLIKLRIEWFNSIHSHCSNKGVMMKYLLAVLDEQSENVMWADDNSHYDIVWAFDFRSDMFSDYFSQPENSGKVCFTGRTYGYCL